MKKLIFTSLSLAALTLSNMAFGMVGDTQAYLSGDDGYKALQITRCNVYADLQKSMQSSLYALPEQQAEGFGIDDINSYATQQNLTISHLVVEG